MYRDASGTKGRPYRRAAVGNWKFVRRVRSRGKVESGHLIQCFTGLLIAVEYAGPPWKGGPSNVPSPLVVHFHSLTPRSHLPPPPSSPLSARRPISNRSRPLSHLRRSVPLPALILRQINASLSSRRFTNQSGASVQDDRSRAEARTIRNSNENSPLYLPPSSSTCAPSTIDLRQLPPASGLLLTRSVGTV